MRQFRKVNTILCVLALVLTLALPVLAASATQTEVIVDASIPGLIDNLENFNLMTEHSEYLGMDTGASEKFKNDGNRLLRNKAVDGYIVYKTDFDIKSFAVDAFNWADVAATTKDLKAYASSDGKNYIEVSIETYKTVNSVAAEWPMTTYESYDIPKNTRYLKIIIPDNSVDWAAWGTQLSRVVINYNTASVFADPAPCKISRAADIKLSTKTEDASIYYYTNQDETEKLYTAPIKLSNSTQITAYAKKQGMLSSYKKTFVYRSSADEIVDRYGQMKNVSFSGKVTNDKELKDDLKKDEAYYNSLTPSQRDEYGGMLNSKDKYGLHATGYFHIEKLPNGRTVMVTPSGNVYFSLGVNGVGYAGDTYTTVAGREYIYEWLPENTKDSEFKDAYFKGGGDIFSFYVANKIRKTGKPFGLAGAAEDGSNTEFYKETVDRMKKWGFNSEGGFSGSEIGMELKFAATPFLPMPDASVPGIQYFDIFKLGIADAIEKSFAENLPKNVNNPSIIGYFIGNEYHYHLIKGVIPKKKASEVGSKKRLVDMLKEKYNGNVSQFNEAWETTYKSFDEMYEAELSVKTDVASKDMDDFIKLYLDTLYKTISEKFRKYDPNHMIIGDRWLTHPIKDDKLRKFLCEAAGKYIDVLSFNYYTFDVDTKMIKSMFEQSGGKPLLFSEFHYGEPTQGLKGAIRIVDNEEEKGLAYRNYVEKLAATGCVVGTHWFEYLDQAATGRWYQGYGGESFAIGLVNVADRPYKKMLDEVMKTNYNIYDIVLGNKEPYSYDFGPTRGERQSNKVLMIPKVRRSLTVDGKFDGQWPASKEVLDGKDRVLGTGKDGVSAQMHLAWDEKNLYVAAVMTDDTPMKNNNKGFDIWNGDALEMFIGPNNIYQGGALQVKDTQLILSGGIVNNQCQYYWYNNVPTQTPIEMAVAMNEGGKGYTIEGAIPWKALNVINPGNGRMLRFDIGFDDGSGGRDRQFLWNGVDGNAQNRDKWGKAILVDNVITVDEKKITRAEAVFSIINAIGLKSATYNNAFKDVSNMDWYADVVQVAADTGIIKGYARNFRPSDIVTVEEMAVMIANAYNHAIGRSATKSSIDNFTDKNEISPWALESVQILKGLGITEGIWENRLQPKAGVTYLQLDAAIKKLLENI